MNGLQKKLGPLKVWQWAMIGAALGAAILIMKNRSGGGEGEPAGEVFGGTGTGAFGAIDPETGIPYSFEAGGSAGGTAGNEGESLDHFLKQVGQLKDAGLLGSEGEPSETIIERITEPSSTVAGTSTKQQAAKSKTAENKRAGDRKGTSTGSAASPKGSSHTAAPHPAVRAIGGAKALTGPNAGSQQGGGSMSKSGGGGGGGNKGGGGGKKGKK